MNILEEPASTLKMEAAGSSGVCVSGFRVTSALMAICVVRLTLWYLSTGLFGFTSQKTNTFGFVSVLSCNSYTYSVILGIG
jgi:hypothetical protein